MYQVVHDRRKGGQVTPREKLLAAAVDYIADHGITDLSLRELAAGLGTSHRMLIYHFGSKDGLLVAVVREMERRQRAALGDLAAEADQSQAEVARRTWQRLADPSIRPHERLFFELYGRALRGDRAVKEVLDGIVSDQLEPLVVWGIARGKPEARARADARLGLAVFRGLLLDLLATGDRAGVDEAMERFLELVDLADPAT
ncbi:MAG TPA: TetR/AcrR family transcriptional regulator [Actinopolymorphaceae bacterium]